MSEPKTSEANKKQWTLPPRFYPKKYNPDPVTNKLFKPDRTVMVLGRRRTGKTTYTTEMLLRHRRLYPRIFVWTKTKRNNYWQQYVPVHKISQGLDDDELGELQQMNSELYEQWKLVKFNTGKVQGNPLTMHVYEDCVAEGILRKTKHVQRMMMNGRHDGTPCYILAQDHCGLTPGERDNIDEWVLFRPDSTRVLNMIRESFGNEVLEVAKRVWEDGRIFIINTAPRTPLSERLFWYETDKEYIEKMTHRDVTLCNKRWWGEHDVKSQKKKYPYVELPSVSTLMGQHNRSVLNEDGEEAEDEDNETEQIGDHDELSKPAAEEPKIQVNEVEKPNF